MPVYTEARLALPLTASRRMSNYESDDAYPHSPGLKAIRVKATPSRLPPPFIPQQITIPSPENVRPHPLNKRRKPNRRKTRPSQGDTVLINFMDPSRPDIARLVGKRALNSDSGSEADGEEMEESKSEPATPDSTLKAGPNLASLDLVGIAQASVSQRQLQRKRTSEVDVRFALARDEHRRKNHRIDVTGLARVLGNRSYEDDRALLNPGKRSKNDDFQKHSSASLIENDVKLQSPRVLLDSVRTDILASKVVQVEPQNGQTINDKADASSRTWLRSPESSSFNMPYTAMSNYEWLFNVDLSSVQGHVTPANLATESRSASDTGKSRGLTSTEITPIHAYGQPMGVWVPTSSLPPQPPHITGWGGHGPPWSNGIMHTPQTEPVLCIKYTISEDMTKGEKARNKARLSAIADRPRILGSKRSSVLGLAHGRTGIEAHCNHGTLLLKDRSGFSVSSREDLQKKALSDNRNPASDMHSAYANDRDPPNPHHSLHPSRLSNGSSKTMTELNQKQHAQNPAHAYADVKPRLTKEQHDILEAHFQHQHKPSTSTKKGLTERLGVPLDKINNWFQNRRAKVKQDLKKQKIQFNMNMYDKIWEPSTTIQQRQRHNS